MQVGRQQIGCCMQMMVSVHQALHPPDACLGLHAAQPGCRMCPDTNAPPSTTIRQWHHLAGKLVLQLIFLSGPPGALPHVICYSTDNQDTCISWQAELDQTRAPCNAPESKGGATLECQTPTSQAFAHQLLTCHPGQHRLCCSLDHVRPSQPLAVHQQVSAGPAWHDEPQLIILTQTELNLA